MKKTRRKYILDESLFNKINSRGNGRINKLLSYSKTSDIEDIYVYKVEDIFSH